MDSLEIEVDVSEGYINRVKPGQQVRATLDAYPDWTIPARVVAIIPTADRSKATVKVRIGIEEKDTRILPDMGARVSFMGETPKENEPADAGETQPTGVLIPGSAIVNRGGESVVFTIDEHHARAQIVQPGQVKGDLRFVQGIPSGTIVVSVPPAGMDDGARVIVKNQQSVPSSASNEHNT